MNAKKMVILFSPFLALAVLLSGGCAATLVEAQTVPSPTIQQAPAMVSTTTIPAETPVVTVELTSGDVAAPATGPAPWENLPAPILADFTPAQLWADYRTDPLAADAKYYGRTFIFKNVVIEDMAMMYKGYASADEAWVLNRMALFRTDNKTRLLPLKVGYVVDITGVVMGPMQAYVVVDHCTYTIVDTTNGITRPDWQTVFA
jgi:hypothetical protein